MSFYRSVLAAVAAVAIASPVFADDSAMQPSQQPSDNSTAAQTSEQSTTQQAAPSASQEQSANAESNKVNINKATAKDLMKLKGMNASKARAIVAYRKQHGDFKSTDELANVKGFKKMKPDTMKEITDQLSVE